MPESKQIPKVPTYWVIPESMRIPKYSPTELCSKACEYRNTHPDNNNS